MHSFLHVHYSMGIIVAIKYFRCLDLITFHGCFGMLQMLLVIIHRDLRIQPRHLLQPEQFTCLLGKKRAPVAHAETNKNRHNM